MSDQSVRNDVLVHELNTMRRDSIATGGSIPLLHTVHAGSHPMYSFNLCCSYAISCIGVWKTRFYTTRQMQ